MSEDTNMQQGVSVCCRCASGSVVVPVRVPVRGSALRSARRAAGSRWVQGPGGVLPSVGIVQYRRATGTQRNGEA